MSRCHLLLRLFDCVGEKFHFDSAFQKKKKKKRRQGRSSLFLYVPSPAVICSERNAKELGGDFFGVFWWQGPNESLPSAQAVMFLKFSLRSVFYGSRTC